MRMMLEEQVRQGRRCCRLRLLICAGAGCQVSGGVISGEQTRQVSALGRGWSLSRPGEMSQRHSRQARIRVRPHRIGGHQRGGSGLVPPHSFLVRVGGAERGEKVLQGEETTWAKAWGWR